MEAELIRRAESLLKDTFASSAYLQDNPADRDYRLEHSYRVANIAKKIAQAEGFNATYAVIAGLLHDIAYCDEMSSKEDRMNHGRKSAAIARPFLNSLGIDPDAVNDICYAIAIHVDDKADFEWIRTPFSETIGDADNIDRFDAYRIYETLEYIKFSEMTLAAKHEKVKTMIEKLVKLKEIQLGTETARTFWLQRLDFYLCFYQKLMTQLNNSSCVL